MVSLENRSYVRILSDFLSETYGISRRFLENGRNSTLFRNQNLHWDPFDQNRIGFHEEFDKMNHFVSDFDDKDLIVEPGSGIHRI